MEDRFLKKVTKRKDKPCIFYKMKKKSKRKDSTLAHMIKK